MAVPVINGVPRAFDTLPPRKQAFVKEYVRSGDMLASYLSAGYKSSPSSRRAAGRLLREMAPYLRQQTDDWLESVDMAILGNRVLVELATDGKNEAVRFNAAKELRGKASVDKPAEQVVHHKHEDLTPQTLDSRIDELRQKLAKYD